MSQIATLETEPEIDSAEQADEAPQLIARDLTQTQRELVECARRIRTWQQLQIVDGKPLSDAKLPTRLPQIGSTKTFTKILRADFSSLGDLDNWLDEYRAAVGVIDAAEIKTETSDENPVYDDLSNALNLRRAFTVAANTRGINRVIIVEADTGCGKSFSLKALQLKYGSSRVCVVLCHDLSDSPGTLLDSIIEQIGAGTRKVGRSTSARFGAVVNRLRTRRLALAFDEAHHLSPRQLNLIKSLVNATPGEFILLAMPRLWVKLESAAYEEVRQLTGNRLSERVMFKPTAADIHKFLHRRVAFVDETTAQMAADLVEQTIRSSGFKVGNLGFARAVAERANKLLQKSGGSTADLTLFKTCIRAEQAGRGRDE